MYVRCKKNKSGSTSIQVIDKSRGLYRVVQTIGNSSNAARIEELIGEGEAWIKSRSNQLAIDFSGKRNTAIQFLDSIEHIHVAGTELLLGRLFDQIGFNSVDNELFRPLVLSRLTYPCSKLKTTDYLMRYHSLSCDVHQIYYSMDNLYHKHKDSIQRISYEHSLKVLSEKITVLFYDVTTLYFESDDEDELRKRGFSKDGKAQHIQIVLGLLVSLDGYPLAYQIFEGNKFEGHTMLPVITSFKKKYGIENTPIVVADSGLLSQANIDELTQKRYEFILGARLRNMDKTAEEAVLSLTLQNGQSQVIHKDDLRLIVSYSDARAAKDKANRERGLRKLEKRIRSGKLTKDNINNRGYNKYLKLEGEMAVSIDMEKFVLDAKWDGLKGYLTNSKLNKTEVISNYKQLWKIEKAFRVSKHDLQIRPIFHRLDRRIEMHVCISFAAYKVYKELERQLGLKGSKLSPEKAIEIAQTIYSVKVRIPQSKDSVEKVIILTEEQKMLAGLFNF